MMRSSVILSLAVLAGISDSVESAASPQVDRALRRRMSQFGVVPLDPGAFGSESQVELGRALFFDKILSGNRDIACATCHHPSFKVGDGLPLPIGTGGIGLGPGRIQDSTRPFIPRNAPEVFNRGSPAWRNQFWDGRLEVLGDGTIRSPAGPLLPPILRRPLSAQAMFPVTSRDEMRGLPGDPGNELALIPDHDFPAIWRTLTDRLLAIPEYRARFEDAYPGLPPGALGFEHAAEALAAFQSTAFASVDSPFDRYLAGDNGALSVREKRGAFLFFGKARCAACHNGPLLSDQSFHNLAVPQFGPGKPPEQPLDFGRARETGLPRDRFAFRTPPLRNVALTGPWMHNGAYSTLEDAVKHHLFPIRGLLGYDESQLPDGLAVTVLEERSIRIALILGISAELTRPPSARLSRREFGDLIAFLEALTDPSAEDLDHWIPERVPSGLPVDRTDLQ